MIIVSGTIEVPQEKVDAYKEAVQEVVAATRAEAGCLKYGFYQSLDEPTKFRVYEEWEDKDALRAHGQSDHMAAWREKGQELGITGRDIDMIEPARTRKL